MKEILKEANDLYGTLSTAGKWNSYQPGRVSSCWNCGGPHGLRQCKKPKDQKRIDENKKKFDEFKAKKQGGSNNDTNNVQQNESGSYRRRKWGVTGQATNSSITMKPDSNGLGLINGVLHMHCKKCGWNQTHTTGHHVSWKSNPASFVLPSEHPYSKIMSPSRQYPPSSVINPHSAMASVAPSNTSTLVAADDADSMVISRSKTKTALEMAARTTDSADVAEALEAVARALNLN